MKFSIYLLSIEGSIVLLTKFLKLLVVRFSHDTRIAEYFIKLHISSISSDLSFSNEASSRVWQCLWATIGRSAFIKHTASNIDRGFRTLTRLMVQITRDCFSRGIMRISNPWCKRDRGATLEKGLQFLQKQRTDSCRLTAKRNSWSYLTSP